MKSLRIVLISVIVVAFGLSMSLLTVSSKSAPVNTSSQISAENLSQEENPPLTDSPEVPLVGSQPEMLEKDVFMTSFFPDPSFAACVWANVLGKQGDPTSDYKLSAADLEAIRNCEKLELAQSGIHTLAGIQYFNFLKELDCTGNRLTTLDLSKNTELTNLKCGGNKLEALELLQNAKIKAIDCSANKLSSLSIPRNLDLVQLDCSKNKIITLDTSNNEKLRSLKCSENQLIALNISQNNLLTDLDCSMNKLGNLEISSNIDLISLNCKNNNLKELQISTNDELTSIDCSKNLFISLDLSNNTNLLTLTLDSKVDFGNSFSGKLLQVTD